MACLVGFKPTFYPAQDFYATTLNRKGMTHAVGAHRFNLKFPFKPIVCLMVRYLGRTGGVI